MIWCLCGRKHVCKPLQRIFTDGVELYGKNLENEPEVPCSQSGEVFSKSHWTNPSRCDMLMHPRRRAQPASPGRARHPDKRALCVGAVTEATRKLTLNGGAGGCPVKAGWSTLKTEHVKKKSNKKKHIEQQTKKKCSIATTFEVRLVKKGQARKSAGWMPWH